MKRHFFFLALLVNCMVVGYSQTNTLYNVRNNSDGNLLSIVTISKGENSSIYLFAKDTDPFSTQRYLVKLDSLGTIIWQRKVVNCYSDCPQMEFYNNQLYILTSTADGFPPLYTVTKVDINGNILWSKNLNPVSTISYEHPSMVINSTITVASSTYYSIDIFSLDTNGTTNWVRNFETDSSNLKNPNFDIELTSNGDIMGCAKAQSDISFYRLDANGNIKWAKRYLEIDTCYTRVKCILEINNNRFLICGFRANPSGGIVGDNGYAFYGFIDSVGNILDLRLVNELGTNGEIKFGKIANNGSIVLRGYDSNMKLIYINIDTLGNVIEAYRLPQLLDDPINYHNKNTIVEIGNARYYSENTKLLKLFSYDSLTCLDIVPITLTFTGNDPSIAAISGYFAIQTPGTIAADTSLQFTTCDLVIENECSPLGLNQININSINIFPTALNNNESIFVNHNLENTIIDYQILDLNGKVVAVNTLKDHSIAINGLSAGMYVIQFAVKGNVLQSDKFVVVN